jgi:uracil-DNA glycosylase family 4
MKTPLVTRESMLREMGINTLWRQKGGESESAVEVPSAPVLVTIEVSLPIAPVVHESALVQSPSNTSSNWDELAQEVANCRSCVLYEHRNQAVLGVGDLRPDWLFVGEGPGAEEDAKGEPFVGQAGKLLDNMLAALSIKRGKGVYIANAVKCRPQGNRTPEHVEMASCRPFLEKQIAWLKPKIIVLLGRAAVHSVLKEDKSLGTLRQQCFEYQGIPVVVTYHPAYLLRNLVDKSKAWEDLLFARQCL